MRKSGKIKYYENTTVKIIRRRRRWSEITRCYSYENIMQLRVNISWFMRLSLNFKFALSFAASIKRFSSSDEIILLISPRRLVVIELIKFNYQGSKRKKKSIFISISHHFHFFYLLQQTRKRTLTTGRRKWSEIRIKHESDIETFPCEPEWDKKMACRSFS